MTTFFTIWTGQALSLVGSSLVQFALVWWLTHTSGSATVLATANMMELLPRIFVSPVAGALVDRWNRRLVMMVAEGIAFCIGFLNPILTGSLMAMFQGIAPLDMHGRVFALMVGATAVATPLGLAIAGPVEDALGVQAWFLIAASSQWSWG